MAHSLSGQLVRFVAVGSLSAVVDFGLMWLLMGAGMPYGGAKALSFVAGTATAYALNRRYTFTAEGSWRKFAATMLTYLVTFAVQWGLFVALFPPLRDAWGETAAQVVGFVVAQGTATVVNFVVQRTWIFRDPAQPKPRP